VGDHAQRGDSQAVLIQIGAYAAIMVMGPDSIDKEPAMQLPVCAVGRFLGFETLKNGRRVATFQGAYLGR